MLILFILGFSVRAHAFTNFTADYKAKIMADAETAKAIKAQMEKGVRTGCAKTPGKDMSSCFKAQVSKMDVTSGMMLAGLMTAGVSAADKDHAVGYDSTTLQLMMIDNVMTVLEKTNVQKSFLTQKKGASPEEYVELTLVKEMENEQLIAADQKGRKMLNEKLAQVKPIAKSKWQSAMVANLESRLGAQNPSGRFPASVTQIHRDQVVETMMNDRSKAICDAPIFHSCAVLAAKCVPTVKRVIQACAKSIGGPKILPAEKTQPFFTAMTGCANEKAKAELKGLASACGG